MVHLSQEDCFNSPFLHHAHYVLMSLGLCEGHIVTFFSNAELVSWLYDFILMVLFVYALCSNLTEPEEIRDSDKETAPANLC